MGINLHRETRRWKRASYGLRIRNGLGLPSPFPPFFFCIHKISSLFITYIFKRHIHKLNIKKWFKKNFETYLISRYVLLTKFIGYPEKKRLKILIIKSSSCDVAHPKMTDLRRGSSSTISVVLARKKDFYAVALNRCRSLVRTRFLRLGTSRKVWYLDPRKFFSRSVFETESNRTKQTKTASWLLKFKI